MGIIIGDRNFAFAKDLDLEQAKLFEKSPAERKGKWNKVLTLKNSPALNKYNFIFKDEKLTLTFKDNEILSIDINQLTERPYLTTGNLIKGYYNVDVESVIRPGIRGKDDRPCNSLSGVTIGNYFTPMIPKLQEEVQNEKHIIPEDSMQSCVRGGLPTRQMARNEDYLRRCQQKTQQKTQPQQVPAQ